MFKSIFNAFRVTKSPGIDVVNPDVDPSPLYYYNENENGDPLCDAIGNQWVRDASAPAQFFDPSNPQSLRQAFLGVQRRTQVFAESLIEIAQGSTGGKPCGVFSIYAEAGDPSTAWDTAPVYLLAFTPSTPPNSGDTADYSFAVPRAPTNLNIQFGTVTPLNGVQALSGGFIFAFSETPNTYTPGTITGNILVNWAYYYKLAQG